MKPNLLSIAVEGELPNGLAEADLVKIATAVQQHAMVKKATNVGLKFVTKAESQKLNHTYAGHDYATDVLSFPYSGKLAGSLGDIVVCTPIALEQAARYKVGEPTELQLLIVHGLLHLLGHDHQNESGAASLDHLQSAIMKSLGLEYRNFQWSH